VLEDDDDIRELIGLYLKRDSMEPVLFASPVTFLSWLDAQQQPPDLMIPELSGADVTYGVTKDHLQELN